MATQTRRPTSDTTQYTQVWLMSSGTDRYALIDEESADDADYVYVTTTAGYWCGGYSAFSLAAGSTIDKVTAWVRYKRYSTNPVTQFLIGFIQGTNTRRYTECQTTADSTWQERNIDFATNPATGSAWTQAQVQDNAAGSTTGIPAMLMRTTNTGTTAPMASQFWMVVTYTEGAGSTYFGSFMKHKSIPEIIGG